MSDHLNPQNRAERSEPTGQPLSPQRQYSIQRWTPDELTMQDDWLAMEEPLEIRLVYGPRAARRLKSITVTMRTPGADHDLAVGFLLAEGLIESATQVEDFESSGVDDCGDFHGNTLKVHLFPDVTPDLSGWQRNFLAHGSCGVCGKAALEGLAVRVPPPSATEWNLSGHLIRLLPDRLRESQATFQATGGLHAAAWVDATGRVTTTREDIGRHNAVDKLIGWAARNAPSRFIANHAILVSGRAGFEIIQKSLVAGVPAMIAVGAPSSLAVDLARRYGLTLVGFTSSRRFNIYADPRGLIR